MEKDLLKATCPAGIYSLGDNNLFCPEGMQKALKIFQEQGLDQEVEMTNRLILRGIDPRY